MYYSVMYFTYKARRQCRIIFRRPYAFFACFWFFAKLSRKEVKIMNEPLTVTLDDTGRVLIPITLREQANLKTGDKLTIYQNADSIVMLLPEEEAE